MRTWMFMGLALGLAACNGGSSTSTNVEATDPLRPGSQLEESDDIGVTLAKVGGSAVGSRSFEQAAARVTPADGQQLSSDEKLDILDDLVTDEMLYLEGVKRGLDQDPKVKKVIVNTLLRQEVYSGVRNSDFTQEELEQYFEEHKEEFVVPEKVQVKRIFIKVTDDRPEGEARALAEDIHSQVSADPSKFKELAIKYSEDAYKRRGGDLGFLSREGKPGVDATVTKTAFEQAVGTVSDIFQSGGGFNIIYVANKRERVERSFEQMKGSVLRKVKNDRYNNMYEEYVAKLKADYQIQVDNEALEQTQIRKGRGLRIQGGDRPDMEDEDIENSEDMGEDDVDLEEPGEDEEQE